MAIGARLEQTLKNTQQMILSPQMQQAIKILQMPIMELRAKISQELTANPTLEENFESNETLEDTILSIENDDGSKNQEGEDNFKQEFDRLSEIDDEWRDHFRQINSYQRHTSQDEEKRRYLESTITVSESLHEHLYTQLNILALETDQKEIAKFIIGSIDLNGYLKVSTEQIATTLNIEESLVERILSKIQKFNPVGVGASSLKECLFLQLNTLQNQVPLVREIIENHLDDIARNKFPQVARKLKVKPEDVQKAVKLIAQLEPKPGRSFSSETISYITPDVYIEEKDGQFEVVLNDTRIPHLRISQLYRNVMNNKNTSDTEKNYIREKVNSGQWLIKNIRQRQETLMNIMNEIVTIQQKFLRQGIGHLEPLTMQEVATRLGIHESTVSRAVSKKYVQCPQGLFAIKDFFSVEMKTHNGGTTSAENIKFEIKKIVEDENPKAPLSDQDIILLLEKEGIKLARRTVAKYRKELKIPPSNMRKRY